MTLLQANRERKGYSVTTLRPTKIHSSSCVLIPSMWIPSKLPGFPLSPNQYNRQRGQFWLQQGEVPGIPGWALGAPRNYSLRFKAFHPETVNKVAFDCAASVSAPAQASLQCRALPFRGVPVSGLRLEPVQETCLFARIGRREARAHFQTASLQSLPSAPCSAGHRDLT